MVYKYKKNNFRKRQKFSWKFKWVAILILLNTKTCYADELDTINFIGFKSLKYESNLFRLPSNINQRALLSGQTGSEEIRTTGIGININKLYSLQKFEFNASYVNEEYKKFNYLNFGAINYNGQWNWRISPWLHGNISTQHKEQQVSYLDYEGHGNRNITFVKINNFDATVELNPELKVISKFTAFEVNNERPIIQESDIKQKSVDLELRRDFKSGSSLSYLLSQSQGRFFNRYEPAEDFLIDTGFNELRNEVQIYWTVTAKSSIDARIAYVNRKHDNFKQRDFKGGVGGASFQWDPTPKLKLVTSWQRKISSYQSLNSNYIQSNIILIEPKWHITSKLTLQALYTHQLRQFLGQGPQAITNIQKDNIQSRQILMNWKPTRDITFSTSFQQDKRVSNALAKDFMNTSATFLVKIEL